MENKRNLSMWKILVTSFIIIFSMWMSLNYGTNARASNITPSTTINQIFPDPALAEVVRESLQKAAVTDVVSQNELNGILKIDADDKKIKSIKGIENLTHLKNLFLNDNEISDISMLADLKNLERLSLDGNKVTDLSGLENLVDLVYVSMDENGISDIRPLRRLANLDSLYLDNNKLTDITPLSGLTKLTTLSLEGNQLNDIIALVGLTNLQNLYLSKNQIMDIRGLAALKNLDVLELHDQEHVNKPINYEHNLVIQNTVRDENGTLVSPEVISNGGDYEKPNLKWNLQSYTNEVFCIFYQPVLIGKAKANYYVRLTQPLKAVYTVNFHIDSTVIPTKVETGSLLNEPKSPTKQGYTFKGWYTAKSAGRMWDFKKDQMPGNNLDLYAVFKEEPTEKVVNLTRYVNNIYGNSGVYTLPKEDNSLKKGTLVAHRFKALTVDRETQSGGELWYRLKNIGWTKAKNLSLDRYDKITGDKAIIAYAKVKTAKGNTVWTKPFNTAGAKQVNQLSAFSGKKLRILREAKTPISTWYQFSINGKTIGWADMKALNIFYNQRMEKAANLTRYVNVNKASAAIYSVPVEDAPVKKGTLASHKFKALKIDRQATVEGQLWYRIKNIGWTKATNLSTDKYDKIKYNKAITAYSRIKKASGNAVWTKPYNTAGAKRVKALAAYTGKKLRILREAKTSSATWYQFSINGKTIGWVDTRALNTFYKPSMEKRANLTRYVIARKAKEFCYKLPVIDAPLKKARLTSYKGKVLKVDRQAKVEGQVWYRIKRGSTIIGWTKAANLSAKKSYR
ncbi:GW domain-containing glycosaminoglycan-binding protein [Listeria ivanovii]|uniref:Putative internalin, with GW moduls n=1 Tax=Listeria ivanovii (strain ATCC BAA-678 / PAM 55) TaxID=881621 RepID=G2ZAS2_LISIP|nr:GW domain-containing glycosaminoglycan-binding protein [Listeria ivanovii]AHI54962.1 internalin [Listeria ivanovii WSLC3009]AIS64418.1 internalin [Listeria ivanovii subsp. ivanovii]CBW84833.1 Putative internalin, with GW moduls [Listeria ivanovii subsp. ivanovii PAM 55]SNV36254.1 Internalin B precursor [Listeria ivanovii subsp. ivanovii]SNV82205.1 Internalin B precursor [Listeria ivanovii subsp. ivanovii]